MNSKINHIKNIHLIQYFIQKTWIRFATKIKKYLNFKSVDVYIIGAYHGFNAGDISMGVSIKKNANKLGINTQLISLDQISEIRNGEANKYILGGGAIFSPKNLNNLIKKTENNLSNVAILGVDLHLNHSEENLNYLKNSAFMTSRFHPKKEVKYDFHQKLLRDDIVWHPDLTFAFYPLPDQKKKEINKKIIGLNIFPFFYRRAKKQWVFDCYADKIPYNPSTKLSEHQQIIIAQQYVNLMRRIVQTHLDEGFSVYHLPFALEDDLFAKFCLSNLPVKFLSFSNKPHQIFNRMQLFEKFIPTRLHAHIFAAIAKVPFLSISYGTKCRKLLEHLQVPQECSIDYTSLLDSDFVNQDFSALNKKEFVCRDEDLLNFSTESQLVINETLKRLMK